MAWNEEKAAAIAALREAYHQEVERLAELLRPRFESGELHGYDDRDEEEQEDERERFWKGGVTSETMEAWRKGRALMSFEKLERAVEEHFGLAVTEEQRGDWTWLLADDETARAILAASPFADETDGEGWRHQADHATTAAAWDVLAVARRRGFYVPRADETPHPGHRESCPYGCQAA